MVWASNSAYALCLAMGFVCTGRCPGHAVDYELLRVGAALVLLLFGVVDIDNVTDSYIGLNVGDPRNAWSLFPAGRKRRLAEKP